MQREVNLILTARWYEFEDDFTLTGGGPTDTYAYENTANPLMHIYATAAKLDWFGDNEQVVVGTDTGIVYCPQANGVGWTCRDSNSSVHVFQFKDDKITLYTTNDYVSIKGDVPLSPYWMMGIAVGHFGPLPQSPTPEDFNLQIATMLNDGTVNIYKFNSTTDFTPVLAYTAALDTGLALANLTPEDCVQEWPHRSRAGMPALLRIPGLLRVTYRGVRRDSARHPSSVSASIWRPRSFWGIPPCTPTTSCPTRAQPR